MAGNPTGRRSMRKTLVSSLVFLLISIGCTGTAEAQLASPQCDACRKVCIIARDSCKVYSCLTSGGQPGPSSCQGPNARYVADLQAFGKKEKDFFFIIEKKT